MFKNDTKDKRWKFGAFFKALIIFISALLVATTITYLL